MRFSFTIAYVQVSTIKDIQRMQEDTMINI